MVGVPIAYLVVLIALLVRREPKGLAVSVLFFAASVATAVWAIKQSHSSTAAIGFITIPMVGALAGFFGLAFGRYRTSADPSRRIGAWLGLVSALVIISFNAAEGIKTKSKNRVRDEQQAAHSAEIARDREIIAAALKENPGRERAWLDSAILTRMNDRAFLLAALPNDSISPEILDSLANSPDLGIALEAVRNPATRSETLERVYRTKTYPDYFFQALAAHHHTPANVLRELYRRPRTITGLEIWFAGNPATPREILDEIARTTTDRDVINAMLGNPALDCPLLTQLAVNLMKVQNHDADNPYVMRLNERLPEVCPKAAAQ